MEGCEVAVLLAWVKVAVSRVLGSLVSGRARTVVKTTVGARGTVVTGVGALVISMFLLGILHTGRTMVGEEVPVKEGCLVQGLVLALEGIG